VSEPGAGPICDENRKHTKACTERERASEQARQSATVCAREHVCLCIYQSKMCTKSTCVCVLINPKYALGARERESERASEQASETEHNCACVKACVCGCFHQMKPLPLIITAECYRHPDFHLDIESPSAQSVVANTELTSRSWPRATVPSLD